jgi:hypothetical protein
LLQIFEPQFEHKERPQPVAVVPASGIVFGEKLANKSGRHNIAAAQTRAG